MMDRPSGPLTNWMKASPSSGRAVGEFGITLMVAGNIPGKTQTLPLAIYDRVQANAMGEANALALIAVGGVAVLLFGVSRLGRLRY